MLTLLRAWSARLPEPLRQFLAYAIVGAGTTSLDAALFAAMVVAFDWRQGVQPVAASTLSYAVAASLAYVLNSRFAFRAQHRGDSVGSVVRFAVALGSGAAVAALVFAGVHALGGETAAGLLVAKAASIASLVAWNFALLKTWVFRGDRTAAAQGRARGD